MGKYSSEIRINTKIDTKQASSQLLTLENRLEKAKDKVSDLSEKKKELESSKIPTKEYEEIQNQIRKAETEFNKLIEKQDLLSSKGKTYGAQWDAIQNKLEENGNTIRYAQGELQELVATGKAFTLGRDTEEYAKLSKQLKYAEKDIEIIQAKHDEAVRKMDNSEQNFAGKSVSRFKKVAAASKKVFSGTASLVQSAYRKASEAVKKVGNTAKNVFRRMHKDTKKQNSLLSTLKSRFSGIALSLLVFNWITKGFNAIVASVKEGIKSLALYSEDYNRVISDMMGALNTLRNSFVTAFAPIMTVALPYLTKLIEFLTLAVNKVAQFISALTGRTTWTKAKKQTTDYAESLGEIGKEAKKAYHSLAAFDELNVLNKQNEAPESPGAGGVNPSDIFEEVPIDSEIKKFADKVKEILSRLFEPMEKAWNRQGKKVIDAWKYALKEVSKLAKSIGSDFLDVWNQEDTVRILEDILLIIADIGLIVGNLASQFRAAWEENETGKKIFENIRDLIGIIVSNIKKAADYTVDWAGTLNFAPLLTAFERFTKSLAGPVDFLSGILSDFYTQVLLPLAKWSVEKGLPDLLDILTKFNNEVDWEGIRQRLSQFWDHLAPFAQTIGDGLIVFIGELSEKLKNFLNSEAFNKFLTKIEEWMDNVEPEDVAKGLDLICKAIIGFKVITAFASVFTTITKFLSFFGVGGGGAAAAKGIAETSGVFFGLQKQLVGLGAILFLLEGLKVGKFNKNLSDLLTNAPKEEDYKNLEDYNKALDNFRGEVEELSMSRFDTSGFDKLFNKITGKEIERDENGAIKWPSDIKKSMEFFFGEVGKLAENSGYSTAEGFKKGFTEAADSVTGIIRKFCGDTIGTTEAEFEIHSPSKVFERIGAFLIEGMVNGIGSMEEVLDGSLENVYDTVFGTLDMIMKLIADMVSSMQSKISNVTRGISTIWGAVTSGSSIFGKNKTYAAAAAYQFKMPELATGGITTGTTIAKIGEAGREAVLPLENNTGWMDVLADKIGSGDMTIEINMDGDVVFRNIVEKNEIFKKQNGGNSAFA